MASSLKFVDSIATSPTTRLDLNDRTTWRLHVDGTAFPPPPLEQAIASTLLQDGGVIPASAYGLRTLTLMLSVNAATADATATQLQSFYRELDRPTNILRWEQETTNPVFFRTFRTSADAVEDLGRIDGTRKLLSVNIYAEPFALGLLETPVSAVTVSTDPAAASNGCFVDVDFATPSNANPYFETDVTNWTAINGPTLSRSTAQFHEGVASMLITPNGVSADPRAQSETIVVVAGESWFASGWLRSPGTPTVGITIRWYSDAAGSTLISESGTLAALTADTWTYSSVSAVAPATAIRARIAPRYSGTPAAGTTLFVDEAVLGPSQGIKGDVEAPAIIRWPTTSMSVTMETVLSVRRRGIPSAAPFLFQAEALTQGTDTTTQPNSASFSGSGNNYSRCTFTTATMQTRISTTDLGTASVDLRGTYRVFLRYRKNTATDGINLQIRAGSALGLVNNDAFATPDTTNITTAELGLISIPRGFDPVYGSDGNELAVADSYTLQLRAERTSGAGTIDFDFLLLVPADDRYSNVKWSSDSTEANHWILDADGTKYHARDASGQIISAAAPQVTGGFPLLAPGQMNRIYILRQTRASSSWTLGTDSPVSISYHPRYLSVRPAST